MPPEEHAPTTYCDADKQQKLKRAWALAIAYIAWESHPDTSASSIESTLRSLGEQISCAKCLARLRERVRKVVNDWSLVTVSSTLKSLLEAATYRLLDMYLSLMRFYHPFSFLSSLETVSISAHPVAGGLVRSK